MSDQAVRLVLGCNGDAADSGVDRVGECKIDDARFPAEIDGWLGTFVGQFQKPASTTTRENECKRVARERLVCYDAHFILPRVERAAIAAGQAPGPRPGIPELRAVVAGKR